MKEGIIVVQILQTLGQPAHMIAAIMPFICDYNNAFCQSHGIDKNSRNSK